MTEAKLGNLKNENLKIFICHLAAPTANFWPSSRVFLTGDGERTPIAENVFLPLHQAKFPQIVLPRIFQIAEIRGGRIFPQWGEFEVLLGDLA